MVIDAVRRWGMAPLILAGVAVLLAGCGPQPELDAQSTLASALSETAPSDSSSSAVDDGDTETPDGDTRGPADVAPLEVALPPIGPASPDAPAPFRWYEAMQRLDCSLISDTAEGRLGISEAQQAMFASLAQLCLTLTGEGTAMDWGSAARAVAATRGEADCLVVAVREMLVAAVAAHEADPTAVLARGPAAPGTACPVEITEVSAGVGDSDAEFALRIEGPYLFQVQDVTVDGAALSFEAQEDLSADPPLVTLTASGSMCLPQGAAATLAVSGAGYEVTHQFTPAVSLGDCDAAISPEVAPPADESAATPSASPAG